MQAGCEGPMSQQRLTQLWWSTLLGILCLAGFALYSVRANTFAIGPQQSSPPQNGPFSTGPQIGSPDLTQKQRDAFLKESLKKKYQKMKTDAAEMVKLADELQKSVDKSNSQLLSVHVVETADKIEKLAKQIKGNAKGL